MGIIVHDNYVTREGISIENYYASFSKNITINKTRCISRGEITKEQADLDSDSWNITTPALDSSGNFIFVPKLDSSGNVIMEVEYNRSPPSLKLDASGNIIKTREYDLSKNLTERTPVLIKKTITKYYTVHKETKYKISASLVCYINKDVRLKSLTNNFDHSNVDNMLYNRVESETSYNYIQRFNIEIISDNTNNIYEQLYEKVKSMNIFSDYTDDL